MRETLAYDVFEAAGLPAANTAFYEIILDRGEGETSLGIYTVIEVVDDTMLDRVFGEDKGNIYEAEGSAASLAAGVAANLKNSFQKENNEDAADWSDVEKFHAILHSDKRTTDISAWRKELETVFNVPVFLDWLALATTLQHWDTYGGMSHNYYLYNDAGKLTWISWDHNFILGAMGGGGQNPNEAMPNAGNNVMRQGGLNRNTSFDKAEVTAAQWPLIRYLMDVPDYLEAYKGYLKSGIEGPFNASKMQTRYEAWAKLLEPYAEQQGTSPAFQTGVQSLIQTTKDRNEAVTAFLAG
jgi:spore coat protein CotH